MEEKMDYPHFSPCPVCGAKTSNVTKDRPCSACGCTVDDPHGVISDITSFGAKDFDIEQFLLSFPADKKIDGVENNETLPQSQWTVDEFRVFCKKKKLTRQYARKAEELFLYADLACSKCGCDRIDSRPKSGEKLWRLSCQACDLPIVSKELDKALTQIENFAAYETQFLKANPEEAETPMSGSIADTLARAKKIEEAEALRADRKMVEVFPEEQLSAALEGVEIQSGDSDQKGRIRQTM